MAADTTSRAALYARVSTANNGPDPAMQTVQLRDYCERDGAVAGGFVDTGVSGAKDRRPSSAQAAYREVSEFGHAAFLRHRAGR